MFMIFQQLLFISSNLYHTKVFMQHNEYIIIYRFTTCQHVLQGTIDILFGHLKTNVEVLRHILYEDTHV